jgi:HAT1-interacting factor 1
MADPSATDVPPLLPVESIPPSTDTTSRTQLEDLIAQATAKYTVKDYSSAAELYSQATELQATLNGEMSVDNAELLYSYGKCLYHVAVVKSDVLGSKVAGEKQEEPPKKTGNTKSNGSRADGEASSSGATAPVEDQRVQEEIVAKVVEEKEGTNKEVGKANQPFFHFTGDENFEESDSDEEGVEGEDGGEEEEDDDFANAFEVLDLARILLLRKLESVQAEENHTAEEIRTIKERLSDTHDLQAEISLEAEKFPNAVADLRASLALKEELYPKENSLVAECHYKLSLALEFSSVTQQSDANGEPDGQIAAIVDEAMREEAATEMELAIESCELRVQKEEAELASASGETQPNSSSADPKKKRKKITQADIDDVKEMVEDMRLRLIELRKPPVSINDPTSTGDPNGSNPLSGILGQILGESSEEQKKRLDEASKGANDLSASGLVRRKKDKGKAPDTKEANGGTEKETAGQKEGEGSGAKVNGAGSANGTKRKAVDFAEEVEVLGMGKKARVEDAEDDGT